MGSAIVILLLGTLLWGGAFGAKNFWNNDICTSDGDCSGLNTCDLTFGCTLSIWKVGLVMFGVFLALCAIITAVFCLYRRHFGTNRYFFRRQNQYVPQTVGTTNTWNQQPMVTTTTAFPANPQPNQFYSNSVNPPAYNPYMENSRFDAPMNTKQMPTAPYPSAGYS